MNFRLVGNRVNPPFSNTFLSAPHVVSFKPVNNCVMNASFFDKHSIRLIQAPMAGSQNHRLAAAVLLAGGLCSIPAAMLTSEQLQTELSAFEDAIAALAACGVNLSCDNGDVLDTGVLLDMSDAVSMLFLREHGCCSLVDVAAKFGVDVRDSLLYFASETQELLPEKPSVVVVDVLVCDGDAVADAGVTLPPLPTTVPASHVRQISCWMCLDKTLLFEASSKGSDALLLHLNTVHRTNFFPGCVCGQFFPSLKTLRCHARKSVGCAKSAQFCFCLACNRSKPLSGPAYFAHLNDSHGAHFLEQVTCLRCEICGFVASSHIQADSHAAACSKRDEVVAVYNRITGSSSAGFKCPVSGCDFQRMHKQEIQRHLSTAHQVGAFCAVCKVTCTLAEAHDETACTARLAERAEKEKRGEIRAPRGGGLTCILCSPPVTFDNYAQKSRHKAKFHASE